MAGSCRRLLFAHFAQKGETDDGVAMPDVPWYNSQAYRAYKQECLTFLVSSQVVRADVMCMVNERICASLMVICVEQAIQMPTYQLLCTRRRSQCSPNMKKGNSGVRSHAKWLGYSTESPWREACLQVVAVQSISGSRGMNYLHAFFMIATTKLYTWVSPILERDWGLKLSSQMGYRFL